MVSIIVAVAQNGVIGCENRLIWHISEDLKRFKRITSGHPVLMGRKTFESLGCKPLPNRTNVVISRNPDYRPQAEGVLVAGSLEQAVALFPSEEEVFIIGGGEIYRHSMEIADKLYLTRVGLSPEGDTIFPEVSDDKWRMVWCENHPVSDTNPIGFEFIDYIRVHRS